MSGYLAILDAYSIAWKEARRRAVRQQRLLPARRHHLAVYYWAHDIHLWDGTIPFTTDTTMIAAS